MKIQSGRKKLRIIGGQWRSRIVEFADNASIRPTPDRVRETLFNWLRYDVPNASCLELYAGSGILSMEALSRGAAQVTLLDQDLSTTEQMTTNLRTLEAKNFTVIRSDALSWLERQSGQSWDLIFLDPPFATDEFERLFNLIHNLNLLTADGFVYVESSSELALQTLPPGWKIHKQKRAAGVHYCLCHQVLQPESDEINQLKCVFRVCI